MVEVGGHACEVHAPPEPRPGRAVVFLHDERERRLQDMPELVAVLEEHGLPAVAPRTGRSWWLDRLLPGFDRAVTPERYVTEIVRGEIARRFGVAPPGIALIGTGMGGQGALRIAYRHPATFPVAAAIAPAIDFHQAMREAGDRDDGDLCDTLWELFGDVERARQETAILHVHPLNWPRHQYFASDPRDVYWHDGAARLHDKLVALGIPHRAILETRGDGRGLEHDATAVRDVVQFVIDALDQESRRLP